MITIVRITLERQTEAYLNPFEEAVRQHPEIEDCFLTTGDANYLLRASTASAAAYEEVYKTIHSRLPGVARIHSSLAMRSGSATYQDGAGVGYNRATDLIPQ